jgi:hypothetical protein
MTAILSATTWLHVSPDGSLPATHWLQEAARIPVVNREVVLPVPRERAWELVTEPAELETWLAEEVEFAPEEGAPLRTEDRGEVREGVVEHVEDRERIVFTWGDSVVEWRLDDHPAGTRFVVTEHRVADDLAVWGPKLSALAAAGALCPA